MTSDQARYIYKKVESESIINIDAIKQEIDAKNVDSNNMDEDKINPYHEVITNKVEKENTVISQMEQWSILSNVVNYVQNDRHPRDFYDLDINTIDWKNHKKIYDWI